MNDLEMSFDIEFSNHDRTIQSAFFHKAYCGESDVSCTSVPSMKHSFIFAPRAILIDRLHDRKLFPVNGADTSIILG